MTKPTSWCIDIRQEHPLLDKFLGRIYHKDIMFKGLSGYDFFGFGLFWAGWWEHNEELPEEITLDQRRERRGKEYYNNLNIKNPKGR